MTSAPALFWNVGGYNPLWYMGFFLLYRLDSGVREYFSPVERACPLLLVDLELQGLATPVKQNKTLTENIN